MRIRIRLLLAAWLVIFLPFNSAHAESLSSLLRDAIAQHPLLRSQQQILLAADAGVDGAQRQFWPTPSISVQRARAGEDDPSYQGDDQVIKLGVKQPLWSGGRLSGNLDKAKARSAGADADLQIALQDLALRLLQSWSDLLAAEATVAAHRQSLDRHGKLLDMVVRRNAEGVSAAADIKLARTRLATAQSDLASAQARRDSTLERLHLLVGRTVDSAQLSMIDEALFPSLTRRNAVELAREISPRILKAKAQAREAEAEIRIARATLYPEISLTAERQFGSFSVAGADPQSRVFIEFNTSFGGGLSNLSALEGARAQYQAALEEILVQQLALDEQVLSDMALVGTLRDRKSALQRAQVSAGEVSESWERQFLAGRKQWQDLMNSAREQAQADAQLADVLGAEQLTNLRLKVLTQGVDALVEFTES